MESLKRVSNLSNFKVFKTSGELETNSYVFSIEEETFVVDPGVGISQYLDRDHEYNVLLTHGHYDHIGGLKEIKVKKLFISPEDSTCLAEPSQNLSTLFNKIFTIDIKWYNIDEHFNTIPAPGHTPGSRIVCFNGYVFTGDVVFSNTVGRADLYYEQSKRKSMKQEMIKTIKHLNDILKEFPKDWFICPGHGEIVTIDRLFSINPFFKKSDNN